MGKQPLSHQVADFLDNESNKLTSLQAVIGLDGFVDEIVSVVEKREGLDRFTQFNTLSQFAQHVERGAGISTNAELFVQRVKLGGNGAIMANAVAAIGTSVSFIGNVGYPNLHPVFEELAHRASVYNIAEPGHTDALEFSDGKLMLGKISSLNDITWDNLIARVGKDRLFDLLSSANLVGLANWTMIPFMSDIWVHILTEICPKLRPRSPRIMFFDLADPERRLASDIRWALELIGRYEQYFETYLGLNEKEAFEIGHILEYQGNSKEEEAIQNIASYIQQRLKISGVIVHPRAYAVAASAKGTIKVDGPFVAKPKISTGAGDHFNAGFCVGKLLGLDNKCALQTGVATSGYYVRTGNSPSIQELTQFLKKI